MTRLASLRKGDWDQFNRLISGSSLTAEEVKGIIAHPKVLEEMIATMRQNKAFRLIHGRFNTLEAKLEMVRSWPGVTEEMITEAIKEARIHINAFEKVSLKKPFLNIIVSYYQNSAHETFAYACERMKEAYGKNFNWFYEYEGRIDAEHIRYLDGTPQYQNQLRIEVVNLAANLNRKKGVRPKDIRGSKSAHAAVLFAAAQDMEWVLQMDGIKVPFVLVGGLELNHMNRVDDWSDVPTISSHYKDILVHTISDNFVIRDMALPEICDR